MKTKTPMNLALALGLFCFLSGCAEPDETLQLEKSKVGSQEESKPAPATEQALQEKYDKLELTCRMDITNQIPLNGTETSEVKSVTAKSDLLKSLGVNPVFQLKLDMTDLESTWELSIKNVTLSHVEYSSPTESFVADRSPIVNAIFKGDLKKPLKLVSADQKTLQINMTNNEGQVFENTTVQLVSFTEGPATSPNFDLKISCHLEAVPKAPFSNEFHRL